EGTYKVEDDDGLCLPCASGFSSSAGQAACQICPTNTFSQVPKTTMVQYQDTRKQLFGAASCTPCPTGFVSTAGSPFCTACAMGTARASGDDECQLCADGSYQNSTGASECLPCEVVLAGSSSLRGSRTQDECKCGAGTFKRPGKGCVGCPQGIDCPGGNDMPLQQAGFWAEVVNEESREISVFNCRNSLECVNGAFGSCALGRQNRACNDCKDYHYKETGVCKECGEGDKMPFIGLAVCLVGLGILLTVFLKVDLSKQRLSYLTVIMTGGQLITAIQALGAIRQLAIIWVEPVKSVMDALSFITLDIDVMKATCFMQSDNVAVKFIMQMLAYPFLLTILLVAYGLSQFSREPVSMDSLWNLNGTILFVLFISLTLSMLMPLQCILNPNGTSSVAANPGIICWDSGDHVVLTFLAVLGMLIYPVSILSWSLWVTLKYPSRVASGAGLTLNIRYRFLFGRFRPERYYFGTLYLVRNLCVTLVPVLFSNIPALQVVVMGAVLQVFAAIQAMLWPWRTTSSNVSDISISLFLVIVLLGAAPLLEIDDPTVLGVLVFVAIVCLFSAGLTVILHALYTRFLPPKGFGAFLCHHKAGAGILCRYMKLAAINHSSSNLFLDSDELESLDLIFDTVPTVRSPELLHRMWCAGEIATAHRNNVPIIPILCDGFVFPDDERIQAIHEVWTEEQKHTLMNFGISMDMIKEAYRHILQLPMLTMPRMGSVEEQESVVVEMLNSCKLPKKAFSQKAMASQKPRILVTGAVADAEAMSACNVMQILLQRETQEETKVVRSAAEAHQWSGNAVYIVVLFSKGLLRVPAFAEILLAIVESSNVEIVTVSADTGFEFPGPDFYKELEANGLREPGLGKETGLRLSKAYRALLSVLALPLSPLGSEGLLTKQVS
ncbi:unnamed protein product, partial [Polarella glacialis]